MGCALWGCMEGPYRTRCMNDCGEEGGHVGDGGGEG